jgi:hypothetical protein
VRLHGHLPSHNHYHAVIQSGPQGRPPAAGPAGRPGRRLPPQQAHPRVQRPPRGTSAAGPGTPVRGPPCSRPPSLQPNRVALGLCKYKSIWVATPRKSAAISNRPKGAAPLPHVQNMHPLSSRAPSRRTVRAQHDAKRHGRRRLAGGAQAEGSLRQRVREHGHHAWSGREADMF